MASSINNAFITQFEAEVHMAYQRMGSKLKNLVRTVNGVNGSTVKFQKVAKGSANTKARHAELVAMDLAHSNVSATLTDYYAADYVDKLDELKVNIDERQVVAQSAAYALGRKTDQVLIDVLDASTSIAVNVNSDASEAMTLVKAKNMMEVFNGNDVPDDGQRYWVVGPRQWSDLLSVDQFSRVEYVGPNELPFPGGMTAKRWMGFLFFVHSGLSLSGDDRKTLAFHKSAIGCGIGSDVRTEVNYIPEKVSHLITSMISLGAVAIDGDAARVQLCDE
tara:strand:+ start:2185 stop:3015 length:831 start_codon:yes stop_codon:yes gene_type:complete